jgi:two-component system phosphate regulon sensor histidine kinase PhoR
MAQSSAERRRWWLAAALLGRRPTDAHRVESQANAAAPALPFAAIAEQASDPLIFAVGGPRADVSARRFLFANSAARGLFQIQRLEGPLSAAVRAPEVLAAIDEALYDGAIGHAQYFSGGTQDRAWRVRTEPLAWSGEQPAALVSLRDETDLRRAERTRADFLANASHELRTPLASLAGFIETLLGHARDDAEARERFLKIMQGQAGRMRRLIDDLLSLSRVELNEHIPPTGRVDLSVAIGEAIDGLAPLAAQRQVVLARHPIPADPAVIAGDRDQILQVIQNLVDNGLKHSSPGGVIQLVLEVGLTTAECATSSDGEGVAFSLLTPDRTPGRRYARFTVADQGSGIARANLPRLTERFYRVEGQKSSERSGAGLGLAIVRHIVNRHRGGLTVESVEGQGSRFAAYFPMAAEESGAT